MHQLPSRSRAQHLLIAKGCGPVRARVNATRNRGASARPRIIWRADMTLLVSWMTSENARHESNAVDGIRRIR